ncbi:MULTISPECIES: IS21 family transposase [Myroides]|uniref:Transposase n=13 Tax=Myroides TaxID=76831 RepID=A0A163UH58_9FLAO|nr:MULTISPECIES: IS21 family transposase [Myroides]KZE73321.1 hypothetical protein AV926_18450 [Myroides marinus]MDM1445106.1 IS21 family transposase [Myroides odoratimimus]MDM1465348.1 IS21 family transposase [Myroides odoratimimus]MDM1474609.1 IS21 family transposase [Myroides odoratimimus]MTG99483.1 IS21 family transposase [Myroides albus]
MANKPISTTMIKSIIKMKIKEISNSRIASSLGISRTTLIKYVDNICKSGLSFGELDKLSEKDLADLFHTPNLLTEIKNDKVTTDLLEYFPYVDRMLPQVGFTRLILWEQYKEKYPEGVQYSRFCEAYSNWCAQGKGYVPIEHKAGEKLFIDYAGKKLEIVCPQTGNISKVEVFVATLGASQYTYVEACASQKAPDFIKSIENALHYFGGVPNCIVPDNLKSAVIKPHRIEPELNQQLLKFAMHYDTTIMPARVRKPKDKSPVEMAVNITYSRIYTKLHGQIFFSINQLNTAIKKLLKPYNDYPFQKKQSSRTEMFLDFEKQALKALPIDLYPIKTYKTATVLKNYHVDFREDKHHYSVPYQYLGKKVTLIVDQNIVEIYHNYQRIAVHPRNRRTSGYSTLKEHLPPKSQYNAGWSEEYFISWANKIGPETKAFIGKILHKQTFVEQSFKSCIAVLSFASKVGNSRLNLACKRALAYEHISYKAIENILKNGLDQQELEQNLQAIPQHENIRGNNYFN